MGERIDIVLSAYDFHRVEKFLSHGDIRGAERIANKAIERTGHRLIHPHILLCRIYVKEKDFIRAIKKKIQIDRIVANDKYTNESTRQYVMYYTFGLLPRDVIIENCVHSLCRNLKGL